MTKTAKTSIQTPLSTAVTPNRLVLSDYYVADTGKTDEISEKAICTELQFPMWLRCARVRACLKIGMSEFSEYNRLHERATEQKSLSK